jgi:hypothetical protein
LLDHCQHRRALDLLLGDELPEDRRFENAEPDIEADRDEDEAKEERHAPAPGEELLARHLAEGEDGEIGEEQAALNTELRPRCDKAPMLIAAGPLHRH